MKLGYLIAVCVAAVVLLVVWLSIDGNSISSIDQASKPLAMVSANDVTGIVLESGDRRVELQLRDSAWVLPVRESYPADANKVRSLLLRLFDLGTSQRIPAQEGAFEKLGIAEDSKENDQYAQVSLLTGDQKATKKLLFGKTREPQGEGGKGGGGQYVRVDDANEVLLIPEPISFETEVAAWLESQVINVRESLLYSIEQYRISGDSKELLYRFKRPLLERGDWGALLLEYPEETADELEESVVSQIRAALENTRLSDVKSRDDSEVEQFDFVTVFRLTTGLEYSVSTVAKENTYLAQVEVARPEALVNELKELQEKSTQLRNAKKAELQDTSTDEAQKKNDDSQALSAEEKQELEAKQSKPLVALSSVDELKELQQRFSPWEYTLPEFQAKKFRYTLSELFEEDVPMEVTP